jgi:hypothetical protein
VPIDWPDGVRHGGDASPVCGFHAERGKAYLDTAKSRRGNGERERAKRQNREVLSTDAGCAGGLTRSSDEASVMEVEQRGQAIQVHVIDQPA